MPTNMMVSMFVFSNERFEKKNNKNGIMSICFSKSDYRCHHFSLFSICHCLKKRKEKIICDK